MEVERSNEETIVSYGDPADIPERGGEKEVPGAAADNTAGRTVDAGQRYLR
jgi:hypothetical protein